MNTGEKIHQLRKGLGMTQEELASQLDVSRQAISKWELGESLPDTENIIQIGKLFGVSTDYLLYDQYESDMDIPAVRINSEIIKTEYRGRLKKILYFVIFSSTFVVLSLWALLLVTFETLPKPLEFFHNMCFVFVIMSIALLIFMFVIEKIETNKKRKR